MERGRCSVEGEWIGIVERGCECGEGEGEV